MSEDITAIIEIPPSEGDVLALTNLVSFDPNNEEHASAIHRAYAFGPLQNEFFESQSEYVANIMGEANLSYKEREVLKLRYGLGQYETMQSLEVVADIFKTGREDVRQVEQVALAKLKLYARTQN